MKDLGVCVGRRIADYLSRMVSGQLSTQWLPRPRLMFSVLIHEGIHGGGTKQSCR